MRRIRMAGALKHAKNRNFTDIIEILENSP